MAVDPRKPRKVLVVHGVQSGTDADLNQDKLIDELIKSRLGNLPLRYECDLYRYENINDAAQRDFKYLLDLLIKTPVGQVVGNTVLDIVGDVVISLANDSTADTIRRGLKEAITKVFAAGNPCYIVAHSLGSIYAFDVMNELMATDGYFDRASRKSWPVQGLLTIGSPIGLEMFRVTGRDRIADLGAGEQWFRWLNIWDRNDPVVSGDILGQSLDDYKIAENFVDGGTPRGWTVRDIAADTGKMWLMAHTAYWDSPVVGDKLIDLIAS